MALLCRHGRGRFVVVCNNAPGAATEHQARAATGPPLIRVPSGNTRLAAVIGDPVRYSSSPALHNAAYDAMGLDIVYVALPISSENLASVIPAMRHIDIVGLSVTIPHKEAIIPYLDSVSDVADRLRAVNCVVHRDQKLEGHNTDGAGFVRALHDRAGFDAPGKKCVVFGAGGAARAVIEAIGEFDPGEIVIVNRSTDSADRAAALGGATCRVGKAEEVADANLIVNATPVGMGDAKAESPVEQSLLNPNQLVVDLIYHPATTRLLAEAQEQGAETMNGLAMLVYQAALQIELWTNMFPPIDVMFDAVK